MPTFLVCAHTDPEMFGRMCSRLAPHPVIAHIDQQSDRREFERAAATAGARNVTFLTDTIRVNWAGYSQVDAMRRLIDAAASHTSEDDYMVMLSGQDYPIKPLPEFIRQLQHDPQQQYIRSFRILESEEKYLRQVQKRYHRDLALFSTARGGPFKKFRGATIRVLDRLDLRPVPPVPRGLVLCHGQTHWALTAKCATELNRSITPQIEELFRSVFASDEKVFHSLFASSRFASDQSQVHGPMDYQGPGNWRYSNFHHIHPSLTKVYTLDDWSEVAGSEKFFIRKVGARASSGLLDRIDSELLDL